MSMSDNGSSSVRARRDLILINAAGFLRSFATGLLGVLLGIYLFRLGFSSAAIGLVIAAGLGGSALATLLVTFYGDRLGRRRLLLALASLGALGGIALAATAQLWWLVPCAFVSMINGMGTDRSAAFALEQAVIPELISNESRTWALSWYNVVLDSAGALGALAAGLPLALHHRLAIDITTAYQLLFVLYVALHLGMAGAYSLLSREIEVLPAATLGKRTPVSTHSRRLITRLAALFAVDSLGGGFLTDALVAYWFFRRFGAAEYELGVLFFAVHVLNALSHLGAAWLARRIGLVKTMVFTHLPSSLFLIAVPFAPTFKAAVALFLLREALVEMDVPTRQSYVAAMVQRHERSFASGITNVTRNVFWAVSSSIAGAIMQNLAFSAPLIAGGGVKITYDVLLYRAFRHLKPPEEIKPPITSAASAASLPDVCEPAAANLMRKEGQLP